MAGVIADTGASAMLGTGIKSGAGSWNNAKLRLFKNNVTPDNTFNVASFTEANFTGYVAATLASSDFGVTSVAAHVASIVAAAKTFTITAGTQDIYGWYITDTAGTNLLASQRDPAAPITMDAAAVNLLSLVLTTQLKDIATP